MRLLLLVRLLLPVHVTEQIDTHKHTVAHKLGQTHNGPRAEHVSLEGLLLDFG